MSTCASHCWRYLKVPCVWGCCHAAEWIWHCSHTSLVVFNESKVKTLFTIREKVCKYKTQKLRCGGGNIPFVWHETSDRSTSGRCHWGLTGLLPQKSPSRYLVSLHSTGKSSPIINSTVCDINTLKPVIWKPQLCKPETATPSAWCALSLHISWNFSWLCVVIVHTKDRRYVFCLCAMSVHVQGAEGNPTGMSERNESYNWNEGAVVWHVRAQ